MVRSRPAPGPEDVSRRDFLATAGTGFAALSALAAAGAGSSSAATPQVDRGPVSKAPFDSIRDYVAALEAHGLLLRIPRIDQDEYLSTALMFRAVDKFGMFGVPGLMFENLRIEGEWLRASGSEDIALYVMDVSSLNLGPERYDGIPETRKPADAMLVTDFTVAR